MTTTPPRLPKGAVFDAEACAIHSTDAHLPPVGNQVLTPEALRAQLLAPPTWSPEVTDESRWALIKQRHDVQAPTPAAVLVPLVQRPTGLTVLLTQRTAHLNDHAGQISFPGGRAEAEDADAIATALRETQEEIGLAAQHIEVIGHLPNYFTITNYSVTPIIALVTPPFDVTPDPFEVAEIFEVPLAFLMNPANHQRRVHEWLGAQRQFFAMPYPKGDVNSNPVSNYNTVTPRNTTQIADNGHYFIWGATAGMLRNLYHLLAA